MRYEDIRKMNILKETMLYDFYNRFSANLENGQSIKKALLNACYMAGIQVCSLELDVSWFVANQATAINALKTYAGFKRLVDKGYIKIKPHTKNAEDETTFTR